MRRLREKSLERRQMRHRIASDSAFICEPLELRMLLNATLTNTINPVNVGPGQTAPVIDLSQFFDDSDVPGTLVARFTKVGIAMHYLSFKLSDWQRRFPQRVTTTVQPAGVGA